MNTKISNTNSKLLDTIADKIVSQLKGRIVKVGIDGFCASGKTTIAQELKKRLEVRQRVVISASSDDFMNPSDIRWRLGKESPLGFYTDALDFDSIERELLFPLGKKGDQLYRTSSYDIQKSKTNYTEQKKAGSETILVFDGLFLQIPRLRNLWDMVIFIDTSYDTCLHRATIRNQERLNSQKEIEQIYKKKYIPGFELYHQEVNP